MEVWKDIEGFEGLYQVSNKGRVKSLHWYGSDKQKIMKLQQDKDGYCVVNLHNGSYRANKKVHRLVAIAFIPNPDGLPQINHKDEDKRNNKVENLEWCNNKYNINYGLHNFHNAEAQRGKKHTAEHIEKIRSNAPGSKPVIMIDDKTGKIVAEFASCSDAARKISGIATNISYACRNGTRCRGYRWEYKK